VQNFKLKSQAVAEKTAKNFRGLLFLPHPVQREENHDLQYSRVAYVVS